MAKETYFRAASGEAKATGWRIKGYGFVDFTEPLTFREAAALQATVESDPKAKTYLESLAQNIKIMRPKTL